MTEMTDKQLSRERLVWLDITRVLCALMILGIHWLRASYNVQLFGIGDPNNLVMDYQGHVGGAAALWHHLFIAGTAPALSVWLTNLIGLFGGFGWQAVSALIIISGFSLAIAQHGKTLDRAQWFAWYGKRAKRILIPYYMVALPLLAICVAVILILQHMHGNVAFILLTKLVSQFKTPYIGVVTSHLFLFDPWQFQWGADFFAPAWWFIPAILLAYVTYPFVRGWSRYGRGIPLLLGSAAITIVAYSLSDAYVLMNESWYYIVLQQSFNFSLGVVLANMWLGSSRPALLRLISDRRAFFVALAVFVIGNICNWTPAIRPVAGMLYGPSLLLMIVILSKGLEKQPRVSRAITSVDSYDLYLVHQPFAFPIALIAKMAFHLYGVFFGWFIFVAVAAGVARLLSIVQRPRAKAVIAAAPVAVKSMKEIEAT